MISPSASRRGIAMILVLSTLVVVVPLLAFTASYAAAVHREQAAARTLAVVQASFPRIETRLHAWLEESARIVLPLDATQPSLVVDRLSWHDQQYQAQLHITAYDLCGMLPVAVVRDSPLGHRMLPEISAELRRMPATEAQSLGLDGWSRRSISRGGRSWYPSQQLDAEPAIGAQVAFDRSAEDRSHTLNINTAPWRMVQEVARDAGIGSLDAFAERRSKGEVISSAGGSRAHTPSETTVTLASSSHAWAFRVDMQIGGSRSSWWLVYTRGPEGWALVRRVPVDG